MRLLPVAGLLLALWGVVILNWAIVLLGLAITSVFVFLRVREEKKDLQKINLLRAYRTISELSLHLESALLRADVDHLSQKYELIRCLLYGGMIETIGQRMGLDNKRYIELFGMVFEDFDFGDKHKDSIRLFLQKGDSLHPAYRIFLEGQKLMNCYLDDDLSEVTSCEGVVEVFVADESIPSSLDELNSLE